MNIALAIIISLFSLQGCSVYSAVTQPDKKNISILAEGTPRVYVLAELGAPVTTNVGEDGRKTDMFTFYEGSGKWWKAGRAIFHSAADVATAGLWEIVGWPTEVAIKGEPRTVLVDYADNEKVQSWKLIKGESLAKENIISGAAENNKES